jgi:glycosyltransferase involved in cell wall biosynthesis
MGERVAFLIGKDPATAHGGDVTMFHLMLSMASERYETEIICLSEREDIDEPGIVRVPKSAVSWPALVTSSMVRRRSLIHTRFDVDGLRAAVEQSSADRFVAMHCHLAEPYLRATGVPRPADDLLISTDVLDSRIWPHMYGPFGRFEARRLRRDERRVAAASHSIAAYDRGDVETFRADGVDSHWLEMTLPPATHVDVAASPPRIVMLGNRSWRPNADAADTMIRLWPRIVADIQGAELWLVGARPTRPARVLPEGVSDVGPVPNVDEVLSACRALSAPVAIGAGVRVKLLEAAARGLPVACTTEAVGAIEAAVGFVPAVDEDDFVARCRELLLSADAAAEEGARLYAANAKRWTDRIGHDAVLNWLGA